MNILLVEDSANEQNQVEESIKGIDGDTHFFFSRSGMEALHTAYEVAIDIFIFDIELADKMNGITLGRKIRKIPQYFDAPFIYCTTYGDKEMKVFRELRCQSFIVKPIKEEEVRAAYVTAVNTIKYHIKYDKNHAEKLCSLLTLKHKGITSNYIVSQIVFFKVQRNKLYVVFYDENKRKLCVDEKRESLQTICDKIHEIGEGNFVRCQKGYIVNLKFVRNINLYDNYIELCFNHNELNSENLWLEQHEGPIAIPIGKEYKKNLHEEEI